MEFKVLGKYVKRSSTKGIRLKRGTQVSNIALCTLLPKLNKNSQIITSSKNEGIIEHAEHTTMHHMELFRLWGDGFGSFAHYCSSTSQPKCFEVVEKHLGPLGLHKYTVKMCS
eukprot:snap_masked-scaffold_12-processed-gene-12.31-mRNA-1 protein AED:1.00 eAED:1.00 QI:0/-1/0/0/-1/1/1/0/112